MVVIMIVVSQLLVIVTGSHLLWMSSIGFVSIVRALTHPVLLMIVVHPVSIDAISVRRRVGPCIVLILIVIFLLKLLLHLRAGGDTTSWNRSAHHHVVANQLRWTVSIRVRVVVVESWWLMILLIVVNQIALLWRCCWSVLLILLSVVVYMIRCIDR